jgi:hypothetical protein
MPVIGFLTSADRLHGFRQGLKDTGYVEGENLAAMHTPLPTRCYSMRSTVTAAKASRRLLWNTSMSTPAVRQ